jgi:hypothetical protein
MINKPLYPYRDLMRHLREQWEQTNDKNILISAVRAADFHGEDGDVLRAALVLFTEQNINYKKTPLTRETEENEIIKLFNTFRKDFDTNDKIYEELGRIYMRTKGAIRKIIEKRT